jgi:hypothetical protein
LPFAADYEYSTALQLVEAHLPVARNSVFERLKTDELVAPINKEANLINKM